MVSTVCLGSFFDRRLQIIDLNSTLYNYQI